MRNLAVNAVTVALALACLLPADVVAQSAAVAPAEIYGRALGTDGALVDRVTVSLIGVRDVETDSSGVFRFVSLSPGTFFLRAACMGNTPVLKNRAIELYRGPATTPLELRSPKTVCGTLAIWTR